MSSSSRAEPGYQDPDEYEIEDDGKWSIRFSAEEVSGNFPNLISWDDVAVNSMRRFGIFPDKPLFRRETYRNDGSWSGVAINCGSGFPLIARLPGSNCAMVTASFST